VPPHDHVAAGCDQANSNLIEAGISTELRFPAEDQAKELESPLPRTAGGRFSFTTGVDVAPAESCTSIDVSYTLARCTAEVLEGRWNLPRSDCPRLGDWADEVIATVAHAIPLIIIGPFLLRRPLLVGSFVAVRAAPRSCSP
jgi:hypothetical protein